jgi:enamine deaminase RidA (YjgF/YER057c/UK114 family)
VVSTRLGAQTEQDLRNVLAVLQAAGATQADVAKPTVHVVAGADIGEAFAASQEVCGRHPSRSEEDERPRRQVLPFQ